MKILGVTRTRSLCKNTFSRHCRRWFFLTNWRKCVGFGPGFGVSFLDRDCAAPFCFGARFSSSRLATLIRSFFCVHDAKKNKNRIAFTKYTKIYGPRRRPEKTTEKNAFFVRALVLRSSSRPVTQNKTIRSPRCVTPSLLAR